VLISDYLSVTVPSYFSVVLGLVLLGIVFFIPDGLIGLARSARARLAGHDLASLLHALADGVARRGRLPGDSGKHASGIARRHASAHERQHASEP
jgi:hypothetical protein